MEKNKGQWVLSLLLVVTLVGCLFALTLHYKNWISTTPDQFRVSSGFYVKTIPYSALDSVVLVERIPPMERLHGFSALEKEKGIFREFQDSLTNKKVYVFVDNIHQQKLKIVYKDSLYVYLNLKDSAQTVELMHNLTSKMNVVKEFD